VSLSRRHRVDVAGAYPDPYFVRSVIESMAGVEWRAGEVLSRSANSWSPRAVPDGGDVARGA
jgi:hypothetical protein